MKQKPVSLNKKLRAYIIGLALGDGNLSNPNGRAVRLRITCDKKYPILLRKIKKCLHELLPQNAVSLIKRRGCVDISCYSNQWEKILGWRANKGSKWKQKVSVPNWIKIDKNYNKECLRGLFQTDGSIYKDRNYVMVNFVTNIRALADDVMRMIEKIGYQANLQKLRSKENTKYTIRIARDSREFIKKIGLWKK